MAMKKVKVNENFSLRYNSREEDSGDTVMDLDINFDNPSEEVLVARLNTWLVAIGRDNLSVKGNV
jgi:hypothetical protein